MDSSYHKSCTENGHRRSDSGRQTRYPGDKYDAHRQSSGSRAYEREKDISTATKDSAYSSSQLLVNRDEIVLSYPEEPIPAKEPVISLDMEDDEERIMQADWGNESDDDDEEDHATMHKQHKRLSTVEREEIERADTESKGTWVRHTADDGRPYYYNSATRESVWEIPKSTTVAPSAPSTSTRTASSATHTHTTTTKHAKADHVSSSATATQHATGSDQQSSSNSSSSSSSRRPHKTPSDTLSKPSQPRSNSAPTASTSCNEAAKTKRHCDDHAREKDGSRVQPARKRDDASTATNTNADKGQRSKSTKMTLQSTERRTSYHSRDMSRETRSRLEMASHRGYLSRRSRSRSPLPPPPLPPRDLYYDDYRSPSPPPFRRYPPYERYTGYYPYNDRMRHSPPPPPPDLRYRYHDLSPPPPPPPPYYRSRERSWERYEAAHRSRYYR
ncbi:hypothetical protein V8B55DRAFT_1531888 [Mucor lusitanicus]|uniref:WW domain-containing protein n=1 Tax=Mucor circinelloides f. lusitanicus TaxID=29924 RepID=A0A8H4BEX9_MUCCL|nr:hypothetical protein FB192DRAFT_1382798 [Mucor lusitanicus]